MAWQGSAFTGLAGLVNNDWRSIERDGHGRVEWCVYGVFSLRSERNGNPDHSTQHDVANMHNISTQTILCLPSPLLWRVGSMRVSCVRASAHGKRRGKSAYLRGS